MSDEDRSPEAAVPGVKPRRTYSKPALRLYGDVRELTAAGNGSTKENSGKDVMLNKFP